MPFPLNKLTGTHQDFLESVVHPRNEKNAQLWHKKFDHCCVLCLRLRKLKIEGDLKPKIDHGKQGNSAVVSYKN